MASFSNWAEDKILDHAFGDGVWTITAPVYLALCETIPTDASTGSTIDEPEYTGYARIPIAAADMGASSGGSKSNVNALIGAACTAGTDTIVGFAICDSSGTGTGNVIMWGTVASVVISTTQTPPTVAIGGLVATLD